MIKNIYFFLFLLILFSCGQGNVIDENVIGNNNENVLVDTTGFALAEKNMRTQLNDYLVAFKAGKIDKIFYYIYPNTFKYLIKQYPEKYPSMKVARDSFIAPFEIVKKIYLEHPEIKTDFEIGEIIKRVDNKAIKLYLVNFYTTVKINLKTKSMKEEVVAISHDDGDNWKFLNNDSEETNGILYMEFPQSTIDKLLSKD